MLSMRYYRRVFQAYLGRRPSQLSFWHERPRLNEPAFHPDSRAFYMTFEDKADYPGPFDSRGIPMLDYRGDIGRQYNPIAVAQYGLACCNRLLRGGPGAAGWKDRFLSCADWLVQHLERNAAGLDVWMHHFDWEYFRTLCSPWYSGLAQGMGLALLARAFRETGDATYRSAADRALVPLVTEVAKGGTLFVDSSGDWWIEEYITDPPTHILNGFVWALWGVRDHLQLPGHSPAAQELWDKGLATLERNLSRYDAGYWSLYDLSPVPMKNLASPFYHALHQVQLEVLARLSGRAVFRECARRWSSYAGNPVCRARALVAKAVFKLRYF